MGIYDRDYEREPQPWRDSYGGGGGLQLRMPQSVVNRIVLVTFLAYLVQVVFFPRTMALALGLHSDWYLRPWQFYQLFTYALVHDPMNLFHVAGNMLGVWMFGRELERRLGGREFLLFYLAAVLAGGLLITLYSATTGHAALTYGASAATVAVVVLFALLYPDQEVRLYFLFPVPMWVLGVLIVGGDLMRAVGATQDNVSWQGHLGGAIFALIYHFQHLRLSRWLPQESPMPTLKRRPKLRVHHGAPEEQTEQHKLDDEVNRILAKISAQGRDSLTRKEKRFLEKASREYKGRRQP